MPLSQILAIIISVTVFNGIAAEIVINLLMKHVDERIDAKVSPALIEQISYFPWEDIYVDDKQGWLYVSEGAGSNWLGLPHEGWYLAMY